jgi:hypothetical protein
MPSLNVNVVFTPWMRRIAGAAIDAILPLMGAVENCIAGTSGPSHDMPQGRVEHEASE